MKNSGRAGKPTPTSDMFSPGDNCPLTSARTLVLCFDGTGDQFDADVLTRLPCLSICRSLIENNHPQNTNIVQFCTTLEKGDKDQQMVYYQVRLT